jgi:hypothetical protein
MTVLRDEQGSWSSARIGLWSVLVFTAWYIISHDKPDTGVLSLLGSALLGFMGWAGGPRVAQYLLPQIGAAAQGIASARPPYPSMDMNEKGDD